MTRRNRSRRVSRMSLKEAYIRGYRAAKRRLKESTSKGIWDIVTDDLEYHCKIYKGDFGELVDDIFGNGLLTCGGTGPHFYKEIQAWYASLGGDKGHWGMEDEVLSQVAGAIEAWMKNHRKEIRNSVEDFDQDTPQEIFDTLYHEYITQIGLETGSRDILEQEGQEDLLDGDDDL